MNIDKLISILLENKPSEKIKQNEDYMFSLIPELKLCKGFNQNNPWHIYDVYEHILRVIDGVPNTLELRLAALFHDLGKPFVYTEDDMGIGHFYQHWLKSNAIFIAFANRYSLDFSSPFIYILPSTHLIFSPGRAINLLIKRSVPCFKTTIS